MATKSSAAEKVNQEIDKPKAKRLVLNPVTIRSLKAPRSGSDKAFISPTAQIQCPF